MRAVLTLVLICGLLIGASGAVWLIAQPASQKEPSVSVRLWASLEPEGEPRDRFLPGQKVFFNARVTVEGARPGRQVTVSLRVTGPTGWRADLLPPVETTAGRLEPVVCRSHQWPEDMPAGLCGSYQFWARVECEGASALDESTAFKVESPVVLEQAWVDTMPLALPRPTSDRLYIGVPFYFHARHKLSDLVDVKQAQVTVAWKVRHAGQDMPDLSTAVTKSLVGDPQELVLTRRPSPRAPSASMLGVSIMECTARLGKFRSNPVRTTFVVSRQPVAAPSGRAVVKLISASASPKVVHPGGEVALVMKYRVSGLRDGEVLSAIERQIITGDGQERLLPMRSVQRGNGTYEVRARFPAPEGAKGEYSYEGSVLGAGKKLCEGRAVFEVREVEIRLFDLSVWPEQLRAGEQVTVAFRFSVAGLARDESLALERVVEVKGPWNTRLTKTGTVSAVPGVSYRTRLDITLPQDAPAGNYTVTATVVPNRGTADQLEASFEIKPE